MVLCDIDPLADWRDGTTEDDVRGLLYVGATRALRRVVIVAPKEWRGVLGVGPVDEFGVGAEDLRAADSEGTRK